MILNIKSQRQKYTIYKYTGIEMNINKKLLLLFPFSCLQNYAVEHVLSVNSLTTDSGYDNVNLLLLKLNLKLESLCRFSSKCLLY